jgi:hypothetical protein
MHTRCHSQKALLHQWTFSGRKKEKKFAAKGEIAGQELMEGKNNSAYVDEQDGVVR